MSEDFKITGLCVGGPLDGQFGTVQNSMEFYALVPTQVLNFEFFEDAKVVTADRHLYRMIPLIIDNHQRHLWVSQDLSAIEAFDKILRGYVGLNSPQALAEGDACAFGVGWLLVHKGGHMRRIPPHLITFKSASTPEEQ